MSNSTSILRLIASIKTQQWSLVHSSETEHDIQVGGSNTEAKLEQSRVETKITKYTNTANERDTK